MISCICIAGLYLQVFWSNIDRSSSYHSPQRPKNQLDLQPCSQTPRASRTYLSWKEVQRSQRKRPLAPQSTPFKKGYMEEKPDSFPSSLSLILSCSWILKTSVEYGFCLVGVTTIFEMSWTSVQRVFLIYWYRTITSESMFAFKIRIVKSLQGKKYYQQCNSYNWKLI